MALTSNGDAKRIVDQLIEERAPGLYGHPLGRALMRALLFRVLHYDAAIDLAETVHRMPAREIFELVSRNLALDVRTEGLQNLPAKGPVLVTPNHPTGIADGIVVYDALKSVRPDLVFFCNRDALRVAPGLADMIIPVEWVADKRTHARSRDTLVAAARAFRDGRCVVLFPAGRLAHLTWRGVVERPWQPAAVNLAKRHSAPLVPMAMDGRNSPLFYAFSRLSNELRDVTLFRELLNKTGLRYRVRIAPPIDVAALDGPPSEIAADLQHLVEEVIPRDGAVAHFRRRTARPAASWSG